MREKAKIRGWKHCEGVEPRSRYERTRVEERESVEKDVGGRRERETPSPGEYREFNEFQTPFG